MNESKNPFAAPDKRRMASRGAIVAWAIAVIMTLAAALLLLMGYRLKAAHESELQAQRALQEVTAASLAHALATIQTNRDFVVGLRKQIADLEREKQQAGQTARTLEDEMREKLASKDVTISKLQGKLTVTIVDRVMFDSGEAILKPDGAAVMQKIADLLKSHSKLQIHVVGHTDNVPIRQTAQTRFASNWELSTARAMAAIHFLTEKADVDPRRVGAVGYGEYRPIADNATPEGRARNRRIEIVVLPEEFAAPDATPLANDPASTNAVVTTPQTPQQ